MPFEIREMTPAQARLIFEWGAKEGWNPGKHDWELIPGIDPAGCFVGLLDGEVVSSLAAVNYQRKYGFLGMYIVRPEYRGRGYGLAVWQHGLNYLARVGVECIGLDGVLANETLYSRSGFKTKYRIVRFGCVPAGDFKRTCPPIEEKHFPDIAAYDLEVFRVDRSAFLHDFLFKSEGKTAIVYWNGKLAGFGMARPCTTGYKIGSLFADDVETARTLMESLFAELAGEPTSIEVPEPNQAALALVDELGMSRGHATNRMYTCDKYDQDTRRVYGVASRTVG